MTDNALLMRTASQSPIEPKPRGRSDVGEEEVVFDYCMVFRAENEELDAPGQVIVDKMYKAGLVLKAYLSVQKDEVVVLIAAPAAKLATFADLIDFKMLLDEDALGSMAAAGDAEKNVAPIEIVHMPEITPRQPYESIYGKYDTEPALQPLYWQPFREFNRLKLINLILQAPVSDGGCALPLRKLVLEKDNPVLAVFPLHNPEAATALKNKWMKKWAWPWDQPLWDIKEYFGEKIALYFTFLGHYTTWCMYAAIFGVAAQLHVAVTLNSSAYLVPFYALFISFWAILLLEFWKRNEKATALTFGMVGFEEEESLRPEFYGQSMKSFIDGKDLLYFPPSERAALVVTSFSSIGTLIIIVIGAVAAIYSLRLYLSGIIGDTASTVASVLNAVQIQIMNVIYGAAAEFLTERENHRTDTQYEDSLIAKLFMFQFVNSYASFFYIAFIQQDVETDDDVELPPVMETLTVNLCVIFGTRLVVGNLTELIVPWASAKKRLADETKGLPEGTMLTSPEQQYVLARYDQIKGTLKDYAELAIQYGYLTLFVAAFPAAPLLAFVSNYIEIRSDARKLLDYQQRPMPTGAEDIGNWQVIFTLISGAAVITNSALVVFVMTVFNGQDLVTKVWLFICFQYFVFGCMFVFSVLVPDTPEDVIIQLQRQEFLVQKIILKVADESDEDLVMQRESGAELHRIPIASTLVHD